MTSPSDATSPTASPTAPGAAPVTAARAGRGGLALAFANLVFIGLGLVQQALLPRAITQAGYGALSRALAFSNIFNNVIVSSSTQGVSRTVAGAGANEREALRATLRVHAAIAVVASGLLALAAPLVAQLQHAPEVMAPLIVLSLVLAVYGVYAPLFGYLNGRGEFTKQAALNIAAATLRTFGLLGVGWLFTRHAADVAARVGTTPGVLGSSVGAVLASIGVFTLALRWTGTGRSFSGARPTGVPSPRAYVGLVLPVMAAQFFTNGLMQADILVLGRYLSLGALDAGLSDPQRSANEWVAAYRAAQLFAFLPYQLLFSVTQVLFPMLARARAEQNREQVAALVARGCRIGAIVCGMLVAVVVALPESLVKFAYGPVIAQQAAASLHLLAVGQAAFAMFGLGTTVLVSLGRERAAMGLTALALVLLASTCFIVIPRATFGAAQLDASALATTVALGLSLVIGVLVLRRVAGAFVPLRTAVRVGGAVALAWVLGTRVPVLPKLVTPLAAAMVVLAYLAFLVLTGEIGKADRALVAGMLARKKAG